MDATYGLHSDMKSHIGVCMSVGGASILNISPKQKINSKSSTLAEMIAISDGLNHVLWMSNLVEAQGYNVKPSRILHDNRSTAKMIHSGECLDMYVLLSIAMCNYSDNSMKFLPLLLRQFSTRYIYLEKVVGRRCSI